MLSTELARDVLVGLAGVSGLSKAACFRSLMRSISSCPLSRVKDRNASKRFLDLKTPFMNILLPESTKSRLLLLLNPIDLLLYWCSIIAFIDSSNDCSNE